MISQPLAGLALKTQPMPEYSDYQKKLINRYYDRHEQILLDRLSELISELYLADTPRRLDQLWKRVAQTLKGLKIAPSITAHLLERRDPKLLAEHLRDWLESGPPRARPSDP